MIKLIVPLLLSVLLVACAKPDYRVVDKQSHEIAVDVPSVPVSVEGEAIDEQLSSSLHDVPGVMIVAIGSEVIVVIPSDPLFAVGGAKMADDVGETLYPFVDIAKRYTNTDFRVEAFTDSSGSELGNVKLSQLRAEGIIDYFMQNDVEKARVIAKGYGSGYPLTSNQDSKGEARNRRIIITVSVFVDQTVDDQAVDDQESSK